MLTLYYPKATLLAQTRITQVFFSGIFKLKRVWSWRSYFTIQTTRTLKLRTITHQELLK